MSVPPSRNSFVSGWRRATLLPEAKHGLTSSMTGDAPGQHDTRTTNNLSITGQSQLGSSSPSGHDPSPINPSPSLSSNFEVDSALTGTKALIRELSRRHTILSERARTETPSGPLSSRDSPSPPQVTPGPNDETSLYVSPSPSSQQRYSHANQEESNRLNITPSQTHTARGSIVLRHGRRGDSELESHATSTSLTTSSPPPLLPSLHPQSVSPFTLPNHTLRVPSPTLSPPPPTSAASTSPPASPFLGLTPSSESPQLLPSSVSPYPITSAQRNNLGDSSAVSYHMSSTSAQNASPTAMTDGGNNINTSDMKNSAINPPESTGRMSRLGGLRSSSRLSYRSSTGFASILSLTNTPKAGGNRATMVGITSSGFSGGGGGPNNSDNTVNEGENNNTDVTGHPGNTIGDMNEGVNDGQPGTLDNRILLSHVTLLLYCLPHSMYFLYAFS